MPNSHRPDQRFLPWRVPARGHDAGRRRARRCRPGRAVDPAE